LRRAAANATTVEATKPLPRRSAAVAVAGGGGRGAGLGGVGGGWVGGGHCEEQLRWQ
jgi:hypothetical protein